MFVLFALFRRIAEPTAFLPPFFSPPEISSFWGLQLPSPLWESKGTFNPVGKKYSIGSSLLTSFPSINLTYLLFSIAPVAVASPLTSPFLPPLSFSLVHGRCFRTWILITYQFFYLSLFLRSFASTSVSLPSIFRKLVGMTLLFTLTLFVLLQKNTRPFIFPLLLLSLIL